MSVNQSRRQFIATMAASTSAFYLSGCVGSGESDYNEINAFTRRSLSTTSDTLDLIRYATLAANGHNTQPWLFNISHRTVGILPDFTRRTPVVDPDDHHLYASLGCAAENLSIASRTMGRSGEVAFDATGNGRIVVDQSPTTRQASLLFDAITKRQVSRIPYEGRSAPLDTLTRLQQASNVYGVQTYLITAKPQMENILQLVIEGNSHQLDDPAFVSELKHWIRFNAKSAAAARDGLYTACSGNPSSPDFIGSMLFNLFFSKDSANEGYAEQIRTSSGLIVFVADTDNPQGWINAGRAYERFALQATVEGLKHSFVNQTIEVPEQRAKLQSLLGLGLNRPNLVVRFGYGPELPKSLRRSVDEVTVNL